MKSGFVACGDGADESRPFLLRNERRSLVCLTDVGLLQVQQQAPQRPDHAHNVFYVPRALGSPHIVAQEEFVMRYGIESVLGFGGLLAWGDLFAAILFRRSRFRPKSRIDSASSD